MWACRKNLQQSGFYLRFRSFDGDDDDGDRKDHDGSRKKAKKGRRRRQVMAGRKSHGDQIGATEVTNVTNCM